MAKLYQPHVVSESAQALAKQALTIDWFKSVGMAARPQPNVQWLKDWDTALASLVSEEWDDYLLDARNAMSRPVPRPQIDDWLWVYDETNKVIEPKVPDTLRSCLAGRTQNAEKAVQQIVGMIRLAFVEAHFQQWIKEPFFQRLFRWLEVGRLPCGAGGEYPSPLLRIF